MECLEGYFPGSFVAEAVGAGIVIGSQGVLAYVLGIGRCLGELVDYLL